MNKAPTNVTYEEVCQAHERIRESLPQTPLTYSHALSDRYEKKIYLKWDNKFATGSFKERGVVNFLSKLSAEDKEKGVCSASAGNHALALSYHSSRMNIESTVFMPVDAPLVKVEASKRNGATVRLEGKSFDEAYSKAQNFSKESGAIFVPGFEHSDIMNGQGTAALEVLSELSSFDAAIVSVGGGGYMAGISTVIKKTLPKAFVCGAQSEWIVQKRKQQDAGQNTLHSRSIADGIAVKTMGPTCERIIQQNVDLLVSVSEQEIARALIQFIEAERAVVEGACAAALAVFEKDVLPKEAQTIVLFVGGSNIDMNLLSRLIERNLLERGQLAKLRVSVPDSPGSLASVTTQVSESGANILETFHDRASSKLPSNVDITFFLEVRNPDHKSSVIKSVEKLGLLVWDLS